MCAEAAAGEALQSPSPLEALKPCLYEPGSATSPAAFNAARKKQSESTTYYQTLLSEDVEEGATRVSTAAGSYGDLPLIVLTASNSGDELGKSAEETAKF